MRNRDDAEAGFVTGFDVRITHVDGKPEIGTARFARILGGEVLNDGEGLAEILDADSAELEALFDVFFDEEGLLKETYQNGNGEDCFYFDEIEFADGWHDKKMEEAFVQRVTETLGAGCAIAIMPVADLHEALAGRLLASGISRLRLRLGIMATSRLTSR